MANVNPKEALGLGIYHFHPRWTKNYGDSEEKRMEEFEDVVKRGYFNSITVEVSYLNNDEFWRIILENDCSVWLNIYDSFYSSKASYEEWVKPFADALDILEKNEERWDRFVGFHFDEPIWRGQSNGDFLFQTKSLYERYHKRIFPVFATGEFLDTEGNAMQLKFDAENMKKCKPEALKYVTDIAFDSYSVDCRDEYTNGSYIDKMHTKFESIVDGKSYYKTIGKYLEEFVGHPVNMWYFPTCYTTGLWRGGAVGEGFCEGHLKFMRELLKSHKHAGGLCLYTYTQFSNPREFGLQDHIVIKDEEGKLKLRPDRDKWYDYSALLLKTCTEFKRTKATLSDYNPED